MTIDAPASSLTERLAIEHLDTDLYRTELVDRASSMRLFGGQIVAQCLDAAYSTVPEDRHCHSIHAYFVKPGDASRPVIFRVDRSRDGSSFTTRRVVAIQNGEEILGLSASFQIPETGFEHQVAKPSVPSPDACVNLGDFVRTLPEIEAGMVLLRDDLIDMRLPPEQMTQTATDVNDTIHVWMRIPGARNLGGRYQQVLLALASDLGLLSAALRPHGLLGFERHKVQTASLDHAVWFHAPVCLDEWHLFELNSPFAGAGRGLNQGRFFAPDGTLVASATQEALMRPVWG